MKQLSICLLMIGVLSGCCASWRCACSSALEQITETVDSVAYRTEDLTVPIPAESASDSVALGDTSRVQTSVAEATAWVEDGRLHQELRNRSEELLRIQLEVPVYFHTEKEYLTRTVVREVKNPPGRMQQALVYLGISALAVGAYALIRALFKARASR